MKEVMLRIKGRQTNVDGEENTIELITEGKFYKKNGTYYLVYDESEVSGMEGSKTTLKIQDNIISMKRFGSNTSNLIFEKGRKHKTEYETVYGDMTMEVMTSKMDVDISDIGKGSINVAYRLNISESIESSNHLSIDIM
ncbi:DUF1934 domain-containing protein [Brassicibacter mesophilus]|jgi:uncharacterized beta-barrel protein YwiB (DUF1934 family)|uniref:DUF1934 domain-containing protein n=1 Tax=Brassicibacter mesophilus TaxID=745119 RepID=UPI003D25C9A0